MPKNHAAHAAAPALTLYTVRLVTEVTAAPDATPETVLAEVLRGLRDGDAYNFEIFAGDDNAAAPVTVCNNDCVAAGQVAPAQTGSNDAVMTVRELRTALFVLPNQDAEVTSAWLASLLGAPAA